MEEKWDYSVILYDLSWVVTPRVSFSHSFRQFHDRYRHYSCGASLIKPDQTEIALGITSSAV